MYITESETDRMAALAQLTLTPEERSAAVRQLEQLFQYAALLEEADTDGVPPTTHVLPLETVLRADEPGPTTPREALLACAPRQDGSCFLVPKAVE